MADSFPYVQSVDKFKEFLIKIKEMGIPNEFGIKQLKSLGYTSSNDKRFIHAIKFIGLVENKSGGGPTELWKKMRTSFNVAIAEGVYQSYSELFHQYPDAYRRDDEALISFFAAHTNAGSVAVGRMVTTFKTMCELADFSGIPGEELAESYEEDLVRDVIPRGGGKKAKPKMKNGGAMTVNINVQLQLPPDETGIIYEKFFQAMSTHLRLGDE